MRAMVTLWITSTAISLSPAAALVAQGEGWREWKSLEGSTAYGVALTTVPNSSGVPWVAAAHTGRNGHVYACLLAPAMATRVMVMNGGDVPPGALMLGIPARQVNTSSDIRAVIEKGIVPTLVHSGICDAMDGGIAQIESGFVRGFAGMQLIGNASEVCRDGKERARAALEALGIHLPPRQIGRAHV